MITTPAEAIEAATARTRAKTVFILTMISLKSWVSLRAGYVLAVNVDMTDQLSR